MAIDGDTSDPIFQVRLIIGDVNEPYYISDDVLAFILSENSDDVYKTALQAVRYMISFFSKKFDQEVGDVRFKWSDLRKNYIELLEELTSNPSMGAKFSLHILGGTDLTEMERVRKANMNPARVKIGMFSDIGTSAPNVIDNPYFVG